MEINTFWRGLILGFSIAAPVGPIGVLCIRRTLVDGRQVGFLSGLGAATADGIYGAIAAFGLTLLTEPLMVHQAWMRLVGGLFLTYLGLRTLFSKPAEQAANAQSGRTLFAAFTSTLLLTFTNPMTILSFSAMFLGITSPGDDYRDALLLVIGVFFGSALWWLTLSGIISTLRSRFTSTAMLWVNRISGVIIFVFAATVLWGIRG